MSNYDAILLTSFGGPEGPDEVMPYLERVTAGRGVPRERLEEVSHHYLELGGVSPINAQNRALLAAMREHFPTRGLDMPIYWGNRNSEPYFADVLKQMYADGHRKILAFVTSAYSSYSGCRQYRENLGVALEETGLAGKLQVDKVRHYFDHPGFVMPVAEDLSQKLAALYEKGIKPSEVAVMFATHSIPSVMGETSGPADRRDEFKALAMEAPAQYGEAELLAAGKELPWNNTNASGGAYAAQHLAAARVIMDLVEVATPASAEPKPLPHWSLVYQSRSGSPTIPWLEPDVNDAINAAAQAGAKAIVIVPIGFISDHVEVVWDLDNEAKETSEELGLEFARVATAGVAPEFVAGIADLIIERETGDGKRKALSPLGPWRDFCSADCCPNSRRELPTVAQL